MGGPLQVGAKALLFAGAVLLLGAGVFTRWIAPEGVNGAPRRGLRAGTLAGAVLVVAGSALGVLDTVSRALGTVDPSMLSSYITDTRDGNAVVARLVILVPLLWLGMGRRRPRWAERVAFVTLGLAFLATISLVSHAGAQPGVLPVPVDLLHLAGVAAWGGALVYGAWLLPWRPPAAGGVGTETAVAHLSTVGLWSLTLMAGTGAYQSLEHLWGPRALVETPYGRVLLIKVAVVAGVAAIAAVNRWVLIPSLARGGETAARLGGFVKAESLLVLAVIGVTSVLVSQAPPGAPPTLSRPLVFQSTVGPWPVRGTVDRQDPGRFTVDLRFQGTSATPPPHGATVHLTLTMLDMAMSPVEAQLAEVRPGTYQGRIFLPMTGRWQMAVHAGTATANIPIQTEDTVFVRPLSPWGVVLPGAALILVGLGIVAAGLSRVGAGVRGSWPVPGAGIAVVILGVILAVRAVQ
jgi:putative copper export protein